MNIQAEKIELIRQITELDSELIIKKIKTIIKSAKKTDETERIMSNPAMVKRLNESREQIIKGQGIKISSDEIWK